MDEDVFLDGVPWEKDHVDEASKLLYNETIRVLSRLFDVTYRVARAYDAAFDTNCCRGGVTFKDWPPDSFGRRADDVPVRELLRKQLRLVRDLQNDAERRLDEAKARFLVGCEEAKDGDDASKYSALLAGCMEVANQVYAFDEHARERTHEAIDAVEAKYQAAADAADVPSIARPPLSRCWTSTTASSR